MPRETSKAIETVTLPDQLFIGMQHDDMQNMAQNFGASMVTLCTVFASHPEMNNWNHRPPVALYKMKSDKLLYRPGFLLSIKEASEVLVSGKNTEQLQQELQAKNILVHSIPGGKYAKWVHVGPYDTLAQSWNALKAYAKENEIALDINPWFNWESYVSDPGSEPDATKWETEIYYRILTQ